MRIVSTLEQARTALTEGERELISPPFAACYAGVSYYRALLTALAEEFPKLSFTFTLCCGDDAAIATDALHMGFSSIVCTCHPAQYEGLVLLANQHRAKLSTCRL